MSEEEWLECTDPARMLLSLQGKTNTRRLALFAVACYCRIRHLLPKHRHGQDLIEASEQFLDGQESARTHIETRLGPQGKRNRHLDCLWIPAS